MTEILTESFCERCGTRYTFESPRPRIRLKGVKTVSRGLKNFVLSDETSMDEAMAAARADTEREATSYQLDAFHKTFNFCMTCRQYTCPNCWNEAEARCLTCAPNLGRDVLPAPFPDLAPTGAVGYEDLTGGGAIRVEGNGTHAPEAAPAPTGDEIDVAARLAALTVTFEPPQAAEPGADIQSEAVGQADALVQPETVAQADAGTLTGAVEPKHGPQPDQVAEPDVPMEWEPAIASEAAIDLGAAGPQADHDPREDAPAAMVTPAMPGSRPKGFFHRFRPGQDIDAELEAYEREQIAAAAAAAAVVAADVDAAPVEPVIEAEEIAQPEAAIAAQPEPVEAVVAPEEIAEPEAVVAAEPEPVAAAEPEPEPVAAADPAPIAAAASAPPAEDIVAQPTWRMVAPDPSADEVEPASPALPAAASADTPAEPQWPTRPEWLGKAPGVGLPFLNRPAAPQGGVDALWAESNREVAAQRSAAKPASAVQPCNSCGLSLSATARFCRRCGTAQG